MKIIVIIAGLILLLALLRHKKCPHCGGRNTIRVKSGFVSVRDWLCCQCGEVFDSLPFR